MKDPLLMNMPRIVSVLTAFLIFCCFGYAGAEKGRIVYSSFQSGSWEIWTSDSLGTNPVQLTQTRDDLRTPSWSPDRQHLAFASNTGTISIMQVSSGEIRTLDRLPGKCEQPVWRRLPKGYSLAFVSYTFAEGEDSDLFEVRLDGKAEQRPTPIVRREAMESHPAWSPDGDRLVYTLFHRDEYNTVVEDLWIFDAVAGQHSPLLQAEAQVFQPDWSPDGRSLVFASNISGNYEIWHLGFHPVRLIRLTDDPGYDADPCWSPDGSEIAFVSTRSGQKHIWIMDTAGQNLRQLTTGPDPSQAPDW